MWRWPQESEATSPTKKGVVGDGRYERERKVKLDRQTDRPTHPAALAVRFLEHLCTGFSQPKPAKCDRHLATPAGIPESLSDAPSYSAEKLVVWVQQIQKPIKRQDTQKAALCTQGTVAV